MTPRQEHDDSTTGNTAPKRRNRARLALAGGALAAGLLPAAVAAPAPAVAGHELPKPPMKAVVAAKKPGAKTAAPVVGKPPMKAVVALMKPPMKVAAPKPAKGAVA
ncbi:hypothetical protein F4556_000566 [Kitasatospora gansuensis]|uniref:Uncharacterized protein n=1 Tax=Kitasatospora gansuensis TaxID=258050 RepID=A0A7W7WF99_9ACTN|nr:hypothetical protein [Kitasatospora gansuensis]MBB4945031.1 hypothetical protein [Kitasatospora gansuensis]